VERDVRYLVDTNVWLELLLEQQKSSIVSEFFNKVHTDQIFISDFALHSIGVILSRFKKTAVFSTFLDDLFVNGQIEQLVLEPVDLFDVIGGIKKFKLDFDDSYQTTVAQKYDLVLVTFDKDFDAKGIIKSTPEEIIGKNH